MAGGLYSAYILALIVNPFLAYSRKVCSNQFARHSYHHVLILVAEFTPVPFHFLVNIFNSKIIAIDFNQPPATWHQVQVTHRKVVKNTILEGIFIGSSIVVRQLYLCQGSAHLVILNFDNGCFRQCNRSCLGLCHFNNNGLRTCCNHE